MDKNKTYRNKRPRLPALLLAAVMVLSMALGALPPAAFAGAAEAAGDTDGKIDIQLLDSSVIGGDSSHVVTNSTESKLSTNSTMSEWGVWADNLTTADALMNAEGLGRLDMRNLVIYEVPADGTDWRGNAAQHSSTGGDCVNTDDGTYFTAACLQNHCRKIEVKDFIVPVSDTVTHTSKLRIDGKAAGLVGGKTYVVTEAFEGSTAGVADSTLNYYGYVPATEKNIGKAWELSFTWADNAYIQVALQADGSWGTHATSDSNLLIGNKQQPLHNEVMRGGFSFKLVDQDSNTNASQGLGYLNDAKFAVFNISNGAQPGGSFQKLANGAYAPTSSSSSGRTENGKKTSVLGYVTVNSDAMKGGAGSAVIDQSESMIIYPAYDAKSVYNAWQKYLEDSAAATRRLSGSYEVMCIEGLYGETGVANNPYAIMTGGKNAELGLFKMGTDDGTANGVPIVPCMILGADANGVVSTGALALPVGTYMVVQIKSGDGYYIDEDFAPIITILPGGKSGYGNAYPTAAVGTEASTTANINRVAGAMKNSEKQPVAYVAAQSGVVDITTACSASAAFGISKTGGYGNAANAWSENGLDYRYGDAGSYPSGKSYKINPDGLTNVSGSKANENGSAVGSRRIPASGRNRFTVYNSVVRAGARFYLADSDDILDTSLGGLSGTSITVEPQGDGDLAGAKFRLRNNVDSTAMSYFVREGDEFNQAMAQRVGLNNTVTMTWGSQAYKEYEAEYDVKTGRYSVTIPVDDLPYGRYTLTQVLTGKGYGHGSAANQVIDENIGNDVEVFVKYLTVARENSVVPTYDTGVDNDTGKNVEAASASAYVNEHYTKNGEVYLPQKLVTGGSLITVNARDASAEDKQITVKVFNISDHYVYVDKDGDGTEERYATRKSDYAANVAPKVSTLKPTAVGQITAGWGDACVMEWTGMVREATVGIAGQARDLPYGTYMMAVTDLATGFSTISVPVNVDSVDEEGKEMAWEVTIGDESRIPNVSTTLVDTDYRIDSVPVKKEASLTDQVDLSNLQADVDYVVYGVVVDKATGEFLPGTGVSYTLAHGYVATGGPSTDAVGGANASALINQGERFNTAAQRATTAYGMWLYDVQDYGNGSSDSILKTQVNRAISEYNSGAISSKTLEDLHLSILARLKYLSGAVTDDSDMAGKAMVDLLYPHIDTTKLEGATPVAYVFVCEGAEPDRLILQCKTVGEVAAATDNAVRALHRNLNDEAQTAYIPSLDIEAKASYTAGKTLDPTETVTGTITYGNVEAGNDYRLVATLKDSYGNTIMKEGGKEPLTVTVDFRAKDTKGYEVVTFEGLDVAEYNGQRLTVYADLLRLVATGTTNTPYWLVTKGDADSMGWKITDEKPGKNQVDVIVPVVTTNLADRYGNKVVDFDGRVTLVDKVHYTTLIPGEKYLSVLTLVDEDGKTLKDDNGKDLTAEKEFTARKAEDDIELSITFDGTNIQGAEVTAFNDLYHITADQRALVAFEHDLETPTQRITAGGDQYRIHFTTSVKDDTTNTKYALLGASVSLTDSVTLRNLEPATKYVLKTEVAIAATGNVISQFEPIYTDVKTDNDGMAKLDVPFKMNTNPFRGRRLVVFQTLYDAKEVEVIASHCDRSDENQIFYVADIDTVLTGANGRSKKVYPDLVEHEDVSNRTVNGELVTIVTKSYTYECELADQVYYSNLTPGNEYMLTTQIVSQDGKGTVATSSLKFTPMNPSGIVTVYLEMDVTDFMGKKVVAYETITDTYTNTIIASHQDLMDTDQTVDIVTAAEALEDEEKPDDQLTLDDPPAEDPGSNPGKNTGKDIQTGVDEKFGLYFGIAGVLAVLAACGGGFYYWKKRRDGQR